MKEFHRITRELNKEFLIYFYSILLQLKDLKVDQWIQSCIRVNIRELDREP